MKTKKGDKNAAAVRGCADIRSFWSPASSVRVNADELKQAPVTSSALSLPRPGVAVNSKSDSISVLNLSTPRIPRNSTSSVQGSSPNTLHLGDDLSCDDVVWKTAPPIEVLKSFAKSNSMPTKEESVEEVRKLSKMFDIDTAVPTNKTSNDKIFDLYNNDMLQPPTILTSSQKSPDATKYNSFVASTKTPHTLKRSLKRRQSSSNLLSENSPCGQERRFSRLHWFPDRRSLSSTAVLLENCKQITADSKRIKYNGGKLESEGSNGSPRGSPFVKQTPFKHKIERSYSLDVLTAKKSQTNHAIRNPDWEGSTTNINAETPTLKINTNKPAANMDLSTDEFAEFDDFDGKACDEAIAVYRATQTAIQMKSSNMDSTSMSTSVTQSSKKGNLNEFDTSEFDDVFGDVDLEDLCKIELKSSGSLETKHDSALTIEKTTGKHMKYQRFIALEVRSDETMLAGIRMPEKILRILNESTDQEYTAKLQEDWYQTEIRIGGHVHVIGEFEQDGSITINNNQNFIIVYPDTLISATHVADSFECLRKSAFQDIFRVSNETSGPMVYGNMLHEIFQICVLRHDFTTETIHSEIEDLIRRNLEQLWSIGETEVTAKMHLREMVPNLQAWHAKYFSQTLRGTGNITVFRSDNREKTEISVSKVLDIEEHIWSPTWGIKGNIDASFEVKSRTGAAPIVTNIMPFELKTGKNTSAVAHRAQSLLYTLMMRDRYDVDVFGSLLFYLKTGEMIKVPYIRDDIRGLLINRNRLASTITERKFPEMLKNIRSCTYCYSLNTCLVYHKAVENGTVESSGLGSLFEKNTCHLSPKHLSFFKKWERLLTKEEGDVQRFRKEVWTMTSEDRESRGNCLSRMRVVSDDGFSQDVSKVHRFGYTLKKAEASNGSTQELVSRSFLKLQLSVGDPIVISSEAGHYALAIGFITALALDSISISVDRRLKGIPKQLNDFDKVSNQSYNSLKMCADGHVVMDGVDEEHLLKALYRIDKDELSAGMALVRGNLVNLFISEGDEKRRRLIVDLEVPSFRPSGDIASVDTEKNLNVDQKRAMMKVLSANDYALILGMPGTGKTTTIAQIIKVLVAHRKSVLLTAYTHSAVDNVLLKLKEEGVDFARLGGTQRTHPDLHQYVPDTFSSVDEVKEFYEKKAVVATTCLGIKHPVFIKRKFDYCIVDEASQLTLPVCLGPLRFANVFVLVGDHYQLPPLVRNAEAKENGLAISLFRLLSETHPDAVTTLQHQYRMCADIMHVSNTLIYNSRLHCGSVKVAMSKLSIPDISGLACLHSTCINGYSGCTTTNSTCWIENLVDPERRVIFIDTDRVPALESVGGQQNSVEAILIGQTVKGLQSCGVQASEIGIISPYRAQLKLIENEIGSNATNDSQRDENKVEVLTVDKYQGRDKNCIVVSLVRSNDKQNVGELLRDWRRLNVAFTRAKQKLLIFGSQSTLNGTLAFAEFFEMMKAKQWMFTLASDAHLQHGFPPVKRCGTREKKVKVNARDTFHPITENILSMIG